MLQMTRPAQVLYTQKAKLYQFFFVDLLKWPEVLETFFAEQGYPRPGMKILDAGCGTGTVTRALFALARREGLPDITFHAFDLTPAMLDIFRDWIAQESAQNIHLRQADVLELERDLPPGWRAYDLIAASTLLEYISHQHLGLALRNLKGLLAQQGRLMLIVTKQTRLTHWLAARWWRTNLFDPAALEELLRQAGFREVQKKTLPGGWDKYLIALEAA